MPDITTDAPVKVTKSASERAVKAAAAAAETLPTVVETAEVALEIPAKVVVNQKLVVTAGILIGAAAGVGGTILFNKLNAKRKLKKVMEDVNNPQDAKSNNA